MTSHTLTELATTTTTAHVEMTNDDLICAVMSDDNATAVELELAQRLDAALTEISMQDRAGQVQH